MRKFDRVADEVEPHLRQHFLVEMVPDFTEIQLDVHLTGSPLLFQQQNGSPDLLVEVKLRLVGDDLLILKFGQGENVGGKPCQSVGFIGNDVGVFLSLLVGKHMLLVVFLQLTGKAAYRHDRRLELMGKAVDKIVPEKLGRFQLIRHAVEAVHQIVQLSDRGMLPQPHLERHGMKRSSFRISSRRSCFE